MNIPAKMEVEYSDEQKQTNHARILEVIHHQKTRGRITEDWMEDQKKFILIIRDFFGNIEMANMDRQDREYRIIAEETEMLLNHLVEEIVETKRFSVDVYYKLSANLDKMVNLLYEEQELCDLMGGL